MINKLIHYCWFGKNPLPDSVKKCIESWIKYMPDYKIIKWDESNYDVNKHNFTKKAYEEKKYAFVSDYARFEILYKYGGIFLDTDVEIIKPLYSLISKGPFMGLEKGGANSFVKTRIDDKKFDSYVAPGLIIYANKYMKTLKEIINVYDGINFSAEFDYLKEISSPKIVTKYLKNKKITLSNAKMKVAGFIIYPPCYFNPIGDNYNSIPKITHKTYSIHHYYGTWLPKKIQEWNIKMREKSKSMTTEEFRLYNNKLVTRIRKSIYLNGFLKTIIKAISKTIDKIKNRF